MVRRLKIQRTPPTSFDFRLPNAFYASKDFRIGSDHRPQQTIRRSAHFFASCRFIKTKAQTTLARCRIDGRTGRALLHHAAIARRRNQSDCAEHRMLTATHRAMPGGTICGLKESSRQNSHNLFFVIWKQRGTLLKRLAGLYRQRQMPSAYQPLNCYSVKPTMQNIMKPKNNAKDCEDWALH